MAGPSISDFTEISGDYGSVLVASEKETESAGDSFPKENSSSR